MDPSRVRSTSHRTPTGRFYRGRQVHAASGLHEFVVTELAARFSVDTPCMELGAGTGAFALRLQDAGFSHVVATDFDPPAGSGVTRLDATCPPNLARFRVVIALEVIEHLENVRGFLGTLASTMAPGASLVISTPNVTSARSRVKFLLRGELYTFSPKDYYETGHITPLPYSLLEAHLRHAGFEVNEVWRVGSHDLSGLGRVERVASRLLTALGLGDAPTREDGSNLVVLASKA